MVKPFEVHTQESNFIKDIDLPKLVIEFDTIKKNRLSIEENITGMKVAMDVPF